MGQANPETGSDIEYEADGDYTITFLMSLPTPPPAKDDNDR
ncbi:hypothetical protein ACIO6U_02730 [Streptomyces sp. NPDC087422]